ncbi:MAG TPA: DinB family protein [Planctomycetota bacterium]|nr:DinB family protein [Planctomycetota bacterium]
MLQDLENPTLRDLHRRARRLSLEFEALAGGLGPGQLAWSPASGSWGIAECLQHLSVTAARSESELQRALARGRRGRSLAPSLWRVPLGRWLIEAAGARAGSRPLRCPRELEPGRAAPENALARFQTGHSRLLALLEAADGLDLDCLRVRTPAHPLVRVRLGEAFELAVAHAERHLAQARRVRADPRFPAGP